MSSVVKLNEIHNNRRVFQKSVQRKYGGIVLKQFAIVINIILYLNVFFY